MKEEQASVARSCLAGAEANTKTFPETVATLTQEGFDGYEIDFRRATATTFSSNGDSIVLKIHRTGSVAPSFDAEAIRAAIREAQEQVPGYSYVGFCKKASAAGCASYVVSLTGRRALYIGRTAETHVELFPK